MTNIEKLDAELDAEKGQFKEPIDWAVARWMTQRRRRRIIVSGWILFTVTIFALVSHSNSRIEDDDWAPYLEGSIPSYAIEYAPVVWLDENEEYFPSSLLTHVENTQPTINYTAIAPDISFDLSNLDLLNSFGFEGLDVYLTSKQDITTSPSWLTGTKPDSSGVTASTSAVIIAVPRDNITTDVFYTYFYSYNQGAIVLGHELGDHVGDWEHNMIRFESGTPQAVWFSQHGGGQAFAYDAVEKIGARPVAYSARGTHANYAKPGRQDRLLPGANLPFSLFLTDYTSRGTLWDPVLNAYWYTYNATSGEFKGADDMGLGGNPVGAMRYKGRWGDQQYGDGDQRQERWWGWRKFVDGPTGPWDKKLVRDKVCPDGGLGMCLVKKGLSGLEADDGDGFWVPEDWEEGKCWE